MIDSMETSGYRRKGGALAHTLTPTPSTLNSITERVENSLIPQIWFGDKPYLVTIDTGVCVTIARHHIVAGTKIAIMEVSINTWDFS
jgi:hypothetical protein